MGFEIVIRATGATEAEATAEMAAQCSDFLERHPAEEQLEVPSAEKRAAPRPKVSKPEAKPALTVDDLRGMALELHTAGHGDAVQAALSFFGTKLSDVKPSEFEELADKFRAIARAQAKQDGGTGAAKTTAAGNLH